MEPITGYPTKVVWSHPLFGEMTFPLEPQNKTITVYTLKRKWHGILPKWAQRLLGARVRTFCNCVWDFASTRDHRGNMGFIVKYESMKEGPP